MPVAHRCYTLRGMEMARIAHTYKHPNGVYYFNLKTPKALSGHFPTQLIRFSLNTKDPRKAAVLAAQHFLRYQAEFDSIRASLAKKTLSAMVAEIERLTGVAASWREEARYHLQRTEETIQQTEEAEERIKVAQRRLARFSW